VLSVEAEAGRYKLNARDGLLMTLKNMEWNACIAQIEVIHVIVGATNLYQ
jgi:hypothetical protein